MFKKSVFRTIPPKREMSIEKSQQPQLSSLTQQKKTQMNVKQVVHSVATERIHFMAKDPHGDAVDKSLLWKGTFPVKPGTRLRHLVFKNVQFILSGWTGDGFPSVIYIGVDGVEGYKKSDLTSTTRVAALQLSDISVVYDESDVRTYDLKYVLRDSATWQIPLTLVDVLLRLYIDDTATAVVLPIPNPITINMEIRDE